MGALLFTYMIPQRRVVTQHDLELVVAGRTYRDIVAFIVRLNEAAKGKELGSVKSKSSSVLALEELLKDVDNAVTKFPSHESSSRFGKHEFRDFYDYVHDHAREWLLRLLKLDADQVDEIAGYFVESWGNRQRIDYGSGHELNFICFLLCLEKINILQESDDEGVVLDVFWRYLATMRRIQKEYWLEPAGSHGVWGLDDYHFLPFLFGSGQLVTHKYLRPLSIHDTDMVEMFADKYYYFGCIYFINSVKSAGLRWHSPMLDDISSAKSWQKVNDGMIKMYKAEVLGKLPIMQHFLFGSLLPAPEGVTPVDQVLQDVHDHNCWADCCGIKVPSAIAAAEATKKPGLRALPFD